MQDLWQRAKSGQHQLLLIAGEPGIGKTRLAGVRAVAAPKGLPSSSGDSDEENLVPPALRRVSELVFSATARWTTCAVTWRASEAGASLDRCRGLLNRIPDLPSPPPIDPEGQRYRLFESVAAMLAVASRARSMLLVFDDLHCRQADTAAAASRHAVRSHGLL